MPKEGLSLRIRLLLCDTAVLFAALPAVWAASLLPGAFGLLLILLVCLLDLTVLILLMSRMILPRIPGDGQPAAITASVLLTGRLQVKYIMAPQVRITPSAIKAGSSMMLLSHAAALLSPGDEPEADAISRCLQQLKVSQDMIRQRMSPRGQEDAHGLHWSLFQDGPGTRAFTWGCPQDILPVCGSMVSRRILPIPESLKLQLLDQLQSQRLQPVCLAMAQVTDGRVGEPVYLGAFLFEDELAADAVHEIAELRRMGLRPFITDQQPDLAQAMNRRLGCDPVPLREAYLFAGFDGDRLSRVLRLHQSLKTRLLHTLIQSTTLLELIAIPCLFMELHMLALLLPWISIHLCLQFCFGLPGLPAHSLRSGSMIRFLLSTAFCCVVMAVGGLYASRCGINATPVATAAILPWLCRCIYACLAQTSRCTARLPMTLSLCVAFSLCLVLVLAGISLLALGFGLSLGGFAASLMHLIGLRKSEKHGGAETGV